MGHAVYMPLYFASSINRRLLPRLQILQQLVHQPVDFILRKREGVTLDGLLPYRAIYKVFRR